jgi:hypothetical protein
MGGDTVCCEDGVHRNEVKAFGSTDIQTVGLIAHSYTHTSHVRRSMYGWRDLYDSRASRHHSSVVECRSSARMQATSNVETRVSGEVVRVCAGGAVVVVPWWWWWW